MGVGGKRTESGWGLSTRGGRWDAFINPSVCSECGSKKWKGGGSWERARAEAEVANKMFEPAKTSFLCVCP